jgi:hypothetical protein
VNDNTQQLDWDTELECGTDEWITRRAFDLATAFGSTWDEQMEQADAIAAALKELRDSLAQQQAQRIASLEQELNRLKSIIDKFYERENREWRKAVKSDD